MQLAELKEILTNPHERIEEAESDDVADVDLSEEVLDENSGGIPSFIIFQYKDNTFLANQYVENICGYTGKVYNEIQTVSETLYSAFSVVIDYGQKINVLKVDTFDERLPDYSKIKNTIVICNSIDKSIKSQVSQYIIELPVLTDWQIKDYMKTFISGYDLDPAHFKNLIDWLYSATDGNIYYIENELSKINLFSKKEQLNIFNNLKFDKSSTLYSKTIFEVADAIVNQDKNMLSDFLLMNKTIKYDPIAISNIILATLKKIVLTKFNSGCTAADIGMSDKQYNAFKRYFYKNITENKARKMIDFISGIDLKLKASELDLSEEKKLDYIICKMCVI